MRIPAHADCRRRLVPMLAPAVAILLTPSVAMAAGGPRDIKPADFRHHIKILASDDFEGRGSGTEGQEKAIGYIATELHKAGLKPAAPDGSWFQPVDHVRRIPRAGRMSWSAGKGAIEISPEELPMVGPVERLILKGAPVIFAGYGIEEGNYRNFADEDLTGAVIFLLSAPPKPLPSADWEITQRKIEERGAAAVISIYPADWRWKNLRDGWSKGTNQLQAGATGLLAGAVHAPTVEKLFAAAGMNFAALSKSAEEEGFRARRVNATFSAAIDTKVESFRSYNVIGRLAGLGHKAEAVALTAHWDGLGICRPEGVEDRICNGAVDNASGTAVLLAIAKRLAEGRPTIRDVLFVATGAEEVGLFGAKTFVSNPPLPLEKLVGALNLDMLALIPDGKPLGVTGAGHTPMDPVIKSVAATLGRPLAEGNKANDILYRLDSFAFHEKGVPAVTAQGFYADGETADKFMSGAYHGPDDEYSEDMELGGAADDANFNLALIRLLADPRQYQVTAPAPE